MTQYQSQYPPYGAPQPPVRSEGRRFPFIAGYVLWFSPALWRDAGRNWRGIGFLYLFLLLLITWGIVFAKGHGSLKDFVKNDVPKFATQVPKIDIKDGVVSTDVPQPYVIKNPETGEPVIIIDTTGETAEPPAQAPSALLTRDKLIVRQDNKMETHDLSQVKAFQLDANSVQNWAERFAGLYWPLFFPAVVAFWLVFRLVMMLIYGVIGVLVGSGVRPPLGYAAALRLSAIAMTPIILLNTILWTWGPDIGCVGLLLFPIVEIVLLIFMVRSNNDPTAQPPMTGFTYGGPTPGMAPQGYGAPAYPPIAPPNYPPQPPAPPPYNPPRPPGQGQGQGY